jgi:hypothetical protein
MGWDSRRHYPADVSKTVTVQATTMQKGRWTDAARRYGRGTPGAFLAWAADMFLTMADTYERQTIRYADACNPPGSGTYSPPSDLKRLVDAAWHALDFLPEDAGSTALGGVSDPKGDLRRALEAAQRQLVLCTGDNYSCAI